MVAIITPALLIGIPDPDEITINKLDLQEGRMFSEAGEGVAIAGLEDKGLGKGDTGHFVVAGRELNITVTGTALSSEVMFPSPARHPDVIYLLSTVRRILRGFRGTRSDYSPCP